MTNNGWGLAQYTGGVDDILRTGFLVDGIVRAAPDGLAARPVLDLLDDWDAVEPVLRGLEPERFEVVEGARLAPPVTYPRKLICAGANYYAHAEEMGTARPDPGEPPFFFLKPPTTTIRASGDDMEYPSSPEDARLDWEAELAVVIAHRCKGLTPEQAPRHIAGYTAANDLSARGGFARPNAVFPPFAWDWLAHKSQDGSCPLGPALVPHWLIADPQDLRISLSVNGAIKQKSSTSDMVAGVFTLVAAASQLMTLEPGDVILTGTPAGVGMPRSEFLQPGDHVSVRIEGIGELETRITAPPG